jgi:SAM-dependent methyltransferase
VIRDKSDVSWEKWGQQDPYYGVFTDDKFRQENLSDELRAEFFETGRVHIGRVLAMALSRCGAMAGQTSALDFGCGVGRLVIPLSRVFEHVTGVDISSSMLKVAEQNCLDCGIDNVDFVPSDDELTRITGKFDFIHSYLVFQHIPIHRGEKIIALLIDRLSDQGILAIHFPFIRKDSIIRKSMHFFRRNFSFISVLANIVRRKRWNEPFIQMNNYDVGRILFLLSEHGIKDISLEVVDAGGFVSAFVFAKKPTHPIGGLKGKHLWEVELDS